MKIIEEGGDVFEETFLNQVMDETSNLLARAQDYLQGPGRIQRKVMPSHRQVYFVQESLRLTTRLSQVMSWLLVQRAVRGGELSPDEARKPSHLISNKDVCLKEEREVFEFFPSDFLQLLDETLSLFMRTLRLEEVFLRQTESKEASPVHAMINRVQSEI